jgi:hypothetical protein
MERELKCGFGLAHTLAVILAKARIHTAAPCPDNQKSSPPTLNNPDAWILAFARMTAEGVETFWAKALRMLELGVWQDRRTPNPEAKDPTSRANPPGGASLRAAGPGCGDSKAA